MGTKKKTWNQTKFPGVRYREHPTRKHGIVKDRYFAIRYQKDGKRPEEGLGWASDGWSAERASIELAALKKAANTGEGPATLQEKRKLEQERREREEAEKKQQEIDAVTFTKFFDDTYYPQAKNDKKKGSWRTEELLSRLWIKPVIGEKPFKEISPIHLERIKKNMADAGKTPRSIHYALATIRQVFNLARAHSVFDGENPVSKVKKPSVDNKRVRFLSRDEAARLMEELLSRSKQLHDISLLSLHCGLRAGEIFNLTWDCIDHERGQILLKDTKSGRNRMAYMTNEVKSVMTELNQTSDSQLVFINRRGRKIKEVSKSFDRAVDEIGLNNGVTDPRQKVVFHTLRHTYASWLVEGGADLYVVKQLMGHSTITMTERYSHLSENALKQAVNQFQGALKGKKAAKSKKVAKLRK